MRGNWGAAIRLLLGTLLLGLVIAGLSPLAAADGGVSFAPRLDQVTDLPVESKEDPAVPLAVNNHYLPDRLRRSGIGLAVTARAKAASLGPPAVSYYRTGARALRFLPQKPIGIAD